MYEIIGVNPEQIKIVLKIVCVTLLFILLKASNTSISDFQWRVKTKQWLVTGILAVVFILITSFFDGFRLKYMFNGDIVKYLFYVLQIAVLTAFFEETLCRGILLSALKGYEIVEWKANIIQAVTFGIPHFIRYLDKGIIKALLITTSQIIVGYFFGKLYIKTRSITPAIIIHFLWDIV